MSVPNRARRILEISASSDHHLFLIGPNKPEMARLAVDLRAFAPPMTPKESEEVSAAHRQAGLLDGGAGLAGRPFRSPHHTISEAGLMGSASVVGEVQLARHGVLFLDQLTEFRPGALEFFAQWMKDQDTNPFILVGGMAGCSCGKLGSLEECQCLPAQIQAHRDRIPAVLLELFDLQVELPAAAFPEREDAEDAQAAVRNRVLACRERQAQRVKGTDIESNGALTAELVDEFCRMDDTCGFLLEKAFTELRLDRRGRIHILKVARTIADMDGSDSIREDDLLEAISYRALDRRIWS